MTKTIHGDRYAKLVDRLRARRRELKLTQEQVAKHLGVSRTWPAKVEQRERRLDCLETWRLCRLYRLDFREIEAILSANERRP